MNDRGATKKEARRQRRQEEKTQRTRAARREKILVGGFAVLIVAVLGIIIFQQLNPAGQPGTVVLDQGNEHLASVDQPHTPYNTTPPTSGPHMGNLWSWGISGQPIRDELQVHNLEDGGVIIQYDCPDESCPELKAQLTALAQELLASRQFAHPSTGDTHLILAPYNGFRDLPAAGGKPIALTAWARIEYLDAFDREKILEFIRAYINIDHHVRGVG